MIVFDISPIIIFLIVLGMIAIGESLIVFAIWLENRKKKKKPRTEKNTR